jgi:hypothetical protein
MADMGTTVKCSACQRLVDAVLSNVVLSVNAVAHLGEHGADMREYVNAGYVIEILVLQNIQDSKLTVEFAAGDEASYAFVSCPSSQVRDASAS